MGPDCSSCHRLHWLSQSTKPQPHPVPWFSQRHPLFPWKYRASRAETICMCVSVWRGRLMVSLCIVMMPIRRIRNCQLPQWQCADPILQWVPTQHLQQCGDVSQVLCKLRYPCCKWEILFQVIIPAPHPSPHLGPAEGRVSQILVWAARRLISPVILVNITHRHVHVPLPQQATCLSKMLQETSPKAVTQEQDFWGMNPLTKRPPLPWAETGWDVFSA